ITGNSTNANGGALQNQSTAAGSQTVFTDCQITGNTAGGAGGAMAIESEVAVNMTGTTVSGNTGSGAILEVKNGMYGANFRLTNTAVTGNQGDNCKTDGDPGLGFRDNGGNTVDDDTCGFGYTAPVTGAELTPAGSDLETNDGWRSVDVAKALDVDGDNIYGTDGWYLFRSASSSAQVPPPYVQVAGSPGTSLYGPAGIYIPFDDPDATGSGSVADVNSGTVYRAGHSQEHDLVVITITEPASFRLGVIQDNHDHAEISPVSLRLRHTAGGNRDSGPLDTSQDQDRDGDYYFFDVTDAQPGEV
ncbi:MAG: hypothetical protein GY938_05125, partial [Ketobacter sp.]|nr:hypothetical protein [Ketobacter sp.]